ncbi:MAG: AraC family transcriptional regulator [Phycisphaerales bacterium]|nr:AraC family transcriptional regulator [Phycisphaerales bacterium]
MTHRKFDSFFGEAGGCECQPPAKSPRAVVGGWPARGVVYDDGQVAVGFTRCRPLTDAPGVEIRSGAHTIAFTTRGVFRMHVGSETLVCDANHVVLQNAGDVFRTSHPGAVGDETIWITYRQDVMIDAVRRHEPSADAKSESPMPVTVAPCPTGAFLLARAMFNEAVHGRDGDTGLVNASARSVLRAVLESGYAARGEKRGVVRATTAIAHVEAAESAKAYIGEHISERITIDQIARHVHASPFHLCRLFRRQTGQPIHKYLNRLRLRVAIDRLEQHRSDLATLATSLGFASHSHFCDAFRREFGVPPSVMRERLLDLRAMQGSPEPTKTAAA